MFQDDWGDQDDQNVDPESLAEALQQAVNQFQADLNGTPVGTPADHECELDQRAHIMPRLQVAEAALLVVKFGQVGNMARLMAIFGPLEIAMVLADITPHHNYIIDRTIELVKASYGNEQGDAHFPPKPDSDLPDIGDIRWIDPGKKGGKNYTN